MKISITIPIYLKGKPHQPAYERCIAHYAKSGFPVVVCGSEGNLSKRFVEPFLSDNVLYVEVPQMHGTTASAGDESLRKKFNDSLAALPESDWYCLVGADDFAPLGMFEQLAVLDPNEVIMAGVGNGKPLLIHQMISGETIRVDLNYKVDLLPGINIFSKGAMLACGGRPYQLKGCETGAERMFKDIGKVVRLDGYIVMLKYKDELNSFDKIKRVHYNEPATKAEMTYVNECLNP